MNFRAAGLILVCMLFARASCQPVRNNATNAALNSTINTLMEQIEIALDHLSDLPNISCSSLNTMKLLALEQQPLTIHHISTFRCYMQKFSELIFEVSQELQNCVEFMLSMENLLTGQVAPKNCSLPTFEQEMYTFFHAKCFLQLVQKTLTDSKL